MQQRVEHDAQAYARSMMPRSGSSNALRTHARTYVRTTHLAKEHYVEYRAQGGSKNFPNPEGTSRVGATRTTLGVVSNA